MPYRIDIDPAPSRAFETLVELGALDVEPVHGGLAAIMPDAVPADAVVVALGGATVRVSSALGRDDDSVWTIRAPAAAHGVRLTESTAFGTGLHATTTLCLDAIDTLVDLDRPDRMLDVGTGSGILALAALQRGVPHATGLDIDPAGLQAAADNARLNGWADRFTLVAGGPDAVTGTWPLVVANIRAAELIELAPVLVRRIAHGGTLILSGIPVGVAPDVDAVYRRLGMRPAKATERDGWAVLVVLPSW
jgi:ribosomal protein L11 methylase PrmA